MNKPHNVEWKSLTLKNNFVRVRSCKVQNSQNKSIEIE